MINLKDPEVRRKLDELQVECGRPAIGQLAQTLRVALGAVSAVFDMWLNGDECAVTLIGLNPRGAPTDAEPFVWDAPFDGALRLA